jgi:hypothetical protein
MKKKTKYLNSSNKKLLRKKKEKKKATMAEVDAIVRTLDFSETDMMGLDTATEYVHSANNKTIININQSNRPGSNPRIRGGAAVSNILGFSFPPNSEL